MHSITWDNIMWCVFLNTLLNHFLIKVRNLTVKWVNHQVTEVGIKERVNLGSQCILSTKDCTVDTESSEGRGELHSQLSFRLIERSSNTWVTNPRAAGDVPACIIRLAAIF
jgi:hypothetical protein